MRQACTISSKHVRSARRGVRRGQVFCKPCAREQASQRGRVNERTSERANESESGQHTLLQTNIVPGLNSHETNEELKLAKMKLWPIYLRGLGGKMIEFIPSDTHGWLALPPSPPDLPPPSLPPPPPSLSLCMTLCLSQA